MIVNRLTSPGHKHYLPPAGPNDEVCPAMSPESVFGVSWYCTRAKGHESEEGDKGDHAAHSDLGRMMSGMVNEKGEELSANDSRLPDMMARWGA